MAELALGVLVRQLQHELEFLRLALGLGLGWGLRSLRVGVSLVFGLRVQQGFAVGTGGQSDGDLNSVWQELDAVLGHCETVCTDFELHHWADERGAGRAGGLVCGVFVRGALTTQGIGEVHSASGCVGDSGLLSAARLLVKI